LHGPGQRQGAGSHVEGRDAVRDVDEAGRWRGPQHNGLADADELVGEAVVAEERDEGRDGFGLFGHGSLPAVIDPSDASVGRARKRSPCGQPAWVYRDWRYPSTSTSR